MVPVRRETLISSNPWTILMNSGRVLPFGQGMSGWTANWIFRARRFMVPASVIFRGSLTEITSLFAISGWTAAARRWDFSGHCIRPRFTMWSLLIRMLKGICNLGFCAGMPKPRRSIIVRSRICRCWFIAMAAGLRGTIQDRRLSAAPYPGRLQAMKITATSRNTWAGFLDIASMEPWWKIATVRLR